MRVLLVHTILLTCNRASRMNPISPWRHPVLLLQILFETSILLTEWWIIFLITYFLNPRELWLIPFSDTPGIHVQITISLWNPTMATHPHEPLVSGSGLRSTI